MTSQSITRVHEIAQLFPLLDGDGLAELAESIRRNGLLMPIKTDPDGVLLDGRNRLKACEWPVSSRASRSSTAIRSNTFCRPTSTGRHLNAGQCALIVALVYPDPEKCGRGRQMFNV